MKWSTLVLICALGCNKDEKNPDTDTVSGDADADTDTDSDTDAPYATNCAGAQIGTFAGDEEGPLTGTLQPSGLLVVQLTTSLGQVNASGQIAEDGTMDGGQADVSIVGNYDLVACSGGGTWTASLVTESGTWEISRDGSE